MSIKNFDNSNEDLKKEQEEIFESVVREQCDEIDKKAEEIFFGNENEPLNDVENTNCESNNLNANNNNFDDKDTNKKNKMSTDKKMRLACVLAVIAFVGCFIFGALKGWVWFIIGAFAAFGLVSFVVSIYFVRGILKAIFSENKEMNDKRKRNNKNNSSQNDSNEKSYYQRTQEEEEQLINEINNAKTIYDNNIAFLKYKSNGAEDLGELASNMFGGKTEDGKSAYKNSSKADKRKTKIILSIIAVSILLILIGGGVAKYSKLGFAFLGLGFVGFVSCIVVCISFSIYESRKYKRYLAMDKSLLDEFYDIKTGVVARCMLHSQLSSGARRVNIIDTLYQVWVQPIDDSVTDIKSVQFDSETQVRLISDVILQKGDEVRFYQNKTKAKDCYLIK